MGACGLLALAKIFGLSVIINVLMCNSEDVDTADYLSQYGFLKEGSNNVSASHTSVSDALKAFQKYYNLEETGELDSETKQKMESPRCGMKDIGDSYGTYEAKWSRNDLTYKVVNRPRGLTKQQTRREIKKAFDVWSAVSDLRFREISNGKPTIQISFENVDHDCTGGKFPPGVLAHGFYPNPSGSVNIHFNDEEHDWTLDFRGQNLLETAVHEIGHTLGLIHTDVKSAIMHAYAKNKLNDPILDDDDKAGIQSLYGKRRSYPRKNKESSQERPQNCHPLWYNLCINHSDCCSENCYKEPHWSFGVCKP